MNAWGIEENQLPLFHIFDAENPVPCGLRFFSDNSNLVTQDPIE
jgi:hypothetical protein